MSEKLIVQFYGICTHVMTEGKYRVILPNAGKARIDDNRVLRGFCVQAHVARLQIRSDDVVSPSPEPGSEYSTWPLDGVTLSIEGAKAPEVRADRQAGDEFPHLSAYSADRVELLPQLFDAPAPTRTDCIFKLPADVIPIPMRTEAGDDHLRPTVGVVTIATPTPTITIRPFDGRAESSITVRPETQITVYSYPATSSADDKNADFLLHFLSMTDVPAWSWFPPAPPWKECTAVIETNNAPVPPAGDPGEKFTGPGCSNSQYP